MKSKRNGPVQVTSTGGCAAADELGLALGKRRIGAPFAVAAAGGVARFVAFILSGNESLAAEEETKLDVAADFQRVGTGDVEAVLFRRGLILLEEANFHFAAAAEVRTESKVDLVGCEHELRVHRQVAGFEPEVVVGARVAHVAADGDRAGEFAARDLADLAALGAEVVVELQSGALRGFEDHGIARWVGRLLARRGEHQHGKVRELNAAVVVALVVVQHEHHGAGFVLDNLGRPGERPVVRRKVGGQELLVTGNGAVGFGAFAVGCLSRLSHRQRWLQQRQRHQHVALIGHDDRGERGDAAEEATEHEKTPFREDKDLRHRE